MKLMAKAPGSVCLELNNDELFSSVAFRFNLRRYGLGEIREIVERDLFGEEPPSPPPPGFEKIRLEETVLEE